MLCPSPYPSHTNSQDHHDQVNYKRFQQRYKNLDILLAQIHSYHTILLHKIVVTLQLIDLHLYP